MFGFIFNFLFRLKPTRAWKCKIFSLTHVTLSISCARCHLCMSVPPSIKNGRCMFRGNRRGRGGRGYPRVSLPSMIPPFGTISLLQPPVNINAITTTPVDLAVNSLSDMESLENNVDTCDESTHCTLSDNDAGHSSSIDYPDEEEETDVVSGRSLSSFSSSSSLSNSSDNGSDGDVFRHGDSSHTVTHLPPTASTGTLHQDAKFLSNVSFRRRESRRYNHHERMALATNVNVTRTLEPSMFNTLADDAGSGTTCDANAVTNALSERDDDDAHANVHYTLAEEEEKEIKIGHLDSFSEWRNTYSLLGPWPYSRCIWQRLVSIGQSFYGSLFSKKRKRNVSSSRSSSSSSLSSSSSSSDAVDDEEDENEKKEDLDINDKTKGRPPVVHVAMAHPTDPNPGNTAAYGPPSVILVGAWCKEASSRSDSSSNDSEESEESDSEDDALPFPKRQKRNS